MLYVENDKYTYNKNKDSEIWLVCPDCNRRTSQTVIFSLEIAGERGGWYSFIDVYEVTQCNGCKAITFRKTSTNSEDFYQDENGELRCDEHEELFPARRIGRRSLEDCHFLPGEVRDVYNETYIALCNKQPLLAGLEFVF